MKIVLRVMAFSLAVFPALVLFPGSSGASEARYFRTYYDSGALKAEFAYKNGKLEGDARWYYENGRWARL